MCIRDSSRSVEVAVNQAKEGTERRHRAQRELRIGDDQATQQEKPERCPQRAGVGHRGGQSCETTQQPGRRQGKHRASAVGCTAQPGQQRERQRRHQVLGAGQEMRQSVADRAHAAGLEVRPCRPACECHGEHCGDSRTYAQGASALHAKALHMKNAPPAVTTAPAPRNNCRPQVQRWTCLLYTSRCV